MSTKTIFKCKEHYIGDMAGYVTYPENYNPEKESLPVIVFLHGAGERGNGDEKSIEKVRVHGIPKYFCENSEHKGLRVITISPQCPEGFIWDQVTFQLKDFLDRAIEKFNGDKSHIAITGISMGGFGTWNMITTYPGYFCCAAPICGGGVSWRADSVLKGMKIRAFHSVDDSAVPYWHSVVMIEKAQKNGAITELTTYVSEDHNCWDRTYEQTDIIEWLATC